MLRVFHRENYMVLSLFIAAGVSKVAVDFHCFLGVGRKTEKLNEH